MSTKRKAPAKLAPPVIKPSAKQLLKTKIDESRTTVSVGKTAGLRGVSSQEAVEISSDSSEDDDDDDDDDNDDDDNDDNDNGVSVAGNAAEPSSQSVEKGSTSDKPTTIVTKSVQGSNGTNASTREEAPGSESDPQSPTLGELARNKIVDVQAQLQSQQQQEQQQQQNTSSSAVAPNQALAPPSLQSLGTVLAQALRSDDTDLLESCLQTTDLNVVRITIQRLDSSLAANLLSRLASRMHRRPGRASTLISWVQWTLIAHGGVLAAQPDLQRKLAELNRVLEERSRGLTSLLALKGKLDMLEAQMQLRRGLSRSSRRHQAVTGAELNDGGDDGDAEDRNVVYVEGEEDKANGKRVDVDDDQFDISVVNGVEAESDSDDDNDDMDDAQGFGRAPAGGEAVDDDDVDFDDVDDESGEDDSDVDAAAPPAKVQKTTSAFPKRR